MASSIPLQIAETVQTAHINRAPSPRHDINPSTAASKKEPVDIRELKSSDHDSIDGDEDEVPFAEIKSRARSGNFLPLPDLRFEQSYLHSIAKADTHWKVAWITVRDQVRSSTLGDQIPQDADKGPGNDAFGAGSCL